MSANLYSLDVLRMAAKVAEFPPLTVPDLKEERRSPTCGSRIGLTLTLDDDRHIRAIGLDAKACALGQAASAIMASHALGKDLLAMQAINEDWRAYLAGDVDQLPDWPGLELLAAGRDFPARHPSMRLAFETAVAALARAEQQGFVRG